MHMNIDERRTMKRGNKGTAVTPHRFLQSRCSNKRVKRKGLGEGQTEVEGRGKRTKGMDVKNGVTTTIKEKNE